MLNTARFVVALSLLLSLTSHAAGAPHGSMSHGFSSHASSSSSSSASRASSAPKSSGFGTFGRQASAPPPGAPASTGSPASSGGAKASGGFGSFSRDAAGAAPRQSDSALSQQLGRDAAQTNALRTLDARRAGTAAGASAGQAGNGTAPAAPAAPGYAQGMPAPQGPTTIIVNQDRGGGLGNVVAGAMIANSMHAHARAGSYPPYDNSGIARHSGTSGGTSGGSVFGLVVTLIVIAVLAWLAYAVWKRVRAARAAAAAKPNYSFERN